jgi:hypothetical protein
MKKILLFVTLIALLVVAGFSTATEITVKFADLAWETYSVTSVATTAEVEYKFEAPTKPWVNVQIYGATSNGTVTMVAGSYGGASLGNYVTAMASGTNIILQPDWSRFLNIDGYVYFKVIGLSGVKISVIGTDY